MTNFSNLGEKALRYYEQSRNDDLISMGDQVWEAIGDEYPDGIADMCFFVRNAHKRKRDHSRMKLWEARAMSLAIITGSRQTIARLLLAPAFACMAKSESKLPAIDDQETSRQILGEMLRVIPESDEEWRPVFERLFYEKCAYSHLLDQEFDLAESAYERAYLASLREPKVDPRGACKVKGAMAVTRFLRTANRGGEVEVASLIGDLEKVIADAERNGWSDVADTARTNLQRMRENKFEMEPFELP